MRAMRNALIWKACIVFALTAPGAAQAADFQCFGGDVACLIAAINVANANEEVNTILLGPGVYRLEAPDNIGGGGPNGLPVITSRLTIIGDSAATTIIERDPAAMPFRLMFVHNIAPQGFPRIRAILRLENLTIRGGVSEGVGGGVWNEGGGVILVRSVVSDNEAVFSGGGVFNATVSSFVIVSDSTIADNRTTLGVGGGIYNLGDTTISASAVVNNSAGDAGGAIFNVSAFGSGGRLIVLTSTVALNTTTAVGRGGALYNETGTVEITNSTIAGNTAPFGDSGGLINMFLGVVELQNTILARNTAGGSPTPDCLGEVASLGNNLIGNWVAPAASTSAARRSSARRGAQRRALLCFDILFSLTRLLTIF